IVPTRTLLEYNASGLPLTPPSRTLGKNYPDFRNTALPKITFRIRGASDRLRFMDERTALVTAANRKRR
ncbi:MAG: hypothetical protein WKG03_08410, partial [Telluria sp.]